MAAPKDLFKKWIELPADFADWLDKSGESWKTLRVATTDLKTRLMLHENRDLIPAMGELPKQFKETLDLFLRHKISGLKRTQKELKGAADTIQGILRWGNDIKNDKDAVDDQYERDIAMWYGELKYGGKKGAELSRKILGAFYNNGVMYRKKDGKWADFSDLKIPVASLLSHGGRVLIQIPMSNSALRVSLSTILAAPKAILNMINPNAILRTKESMNMGAKGAKGAAVGVGAFFANALQEGLSALGPKPAAAGDDRFFDWLDGGTLHKRVAATHSTILNIDDFEDNPLIQNRYMFITEEKAGPASNVADSLAGRHMFKNMVLGGEKAYFNPFSGVQVMPDGGHGHMYVNYRAPRFRLPGSFLVGIEGSAPGVDSQFGKAHTAEAIKGEFSATGGTKWAKLRPDFFEFEKGGDKGDVTTFVCDFMDQHTSLAIKNAGKAFTMDDLDKVPKKVAKADYTEMLKRLGVKPEEASD